MSLPACCIVLLAFLAPTLGSAQSTPATSPAADSTFAAMKARGAVVMGVSQETSEHLFEDLPDGGRIVYRMLDPADADGARTIRRHLRSISDSFAVGVFHAPAEVHGVEAPGTAEMARLRGEIRYAAHDIPSGAELRISSADSSAIAAIHAFLAFQRMDHRAVGHDHMHQP